MERCAGVLAAVSSLPANQGIGDFGRKTKMFIDQIADAGFRIWQVLPMQPLGYGNSPYQPYSSFAGDPIFINIDRLSELELLKQSSIKNLNKFKESVSYEEVRKFKEPYFRKAFYEFKKQFDRFEKEYQTFCAESEWLDDYAVFITFKKLNDMKEWRQWPQEMKEWPKEHLVDLTPYENELFYEKFLQFMFFMQWKEIHAYAQSRGVRIMGDIPFYVGLDSADVWMDREEFLLEEDGSPSFVAGVPPDYFSATGQRWGNPIYDWKHMRANGYAFWIRRLAWQQRCYDIVRIDHFRAFDTYWKIPSSCETAIEGEWIEGEGRAFFDALYQALPQLELVAEDLGDIRPQVLELRDAYQLPGMDVLLFRMEPKLLKRPARKNSIVYTGTHDNDTAEEAYGKFTHNRRIALRRFFHNRGYTERNFHDLLVHFAFDSDANYVIIPLQDILGLKGEGHMNHPGTIGSPNWEWKLKDYKKLTRELEKVKDWLLQAQRSSCREEIK